MAKHTSLKGSLIWCCRLLLSGVFAYAAVSKLIDPPAFIVDIEHYRLLSHPIATVSGIYLPWVELICALGVICRWRERGALVLMVGMCLLFDGAMVSALLRGLDIECGCFGHSNAVSSLPFAFARTMALGLIAFYMLWIAHARTLLPRRHARD